MPTKLKRYAVSFKPDLDDFITADAEYHMRPVGTHVTWICEQYRRAQAERAGLFQNHGGKPPQASKAVTKIHMPPPQPQSASSSKTRAHER